ncbi:hypothetical protein BCO9919_04338 [Burkholderia cenocepacia]|uniref:Uncharacterized protein n=1 Tax=Burkholderia cenocepacia TaxID=95486 RepID=A0A6J5JFF7_9BURK|nr:hypothetical protein BCO9919_04338 [Burkholderia cenocepacia]
MVSDKCSILFYGVYLNFERLCQAVGSLSKRVAPKPVVSNCSVCPVGKQIAPALNKVSQLLELVSLETTHSQLAVEDLVSNV